LSKAFRGELVPQDLKDEPASELLKRIKAQKVKGKKTKKPKRRKRQRNSVSGVL
jgi:type I restriction enzyme S subunit